MSGLQAFIMGVAGVVIVLAIVFIVLGQVRTTSLPCTSFTNVNTSSGCCGYYNATSTYCVNNANENSTFAHSFFTIPEDYKATNTIIGKLSDVPNWIGIIIIVSLAMIVMGFFMAKRGGGF